MLEKFPCQMKDCPGFRTFFSLTPLRNSVNSFLQSIGKRIIRSAAMAQKCGREKLHLLPFQGGGELKVQVIEALAGLKLDYLDQLAFIQECNRNGEKWGDAGVLLMLSCEGEQATLLLNKRSDQVQQPGDLCCPGGAVHPFLDRLLHRLLFFKRGAAYRWAKEREQPLFHRITFFLATALREAWEEIRLNPFRVEFLGALPCYQLASFQRVIFPLVGLAAPGIWHK